jgi:hypothetical protein
MIKNKPRIFYKGLYSDRNERIRTGDNFWDSLYFAADNKESALMYGPIVIKVIAKPDAQILYEGTRSYISISKNIPKNKGMLKFWSDVTKKAKSEGYDAVWFIRQTDVGTAIINKEMFDILV